MLATAVNNELLDPAQMTFGLLVISVSVAITPFLVRLTDQLTGPHTVATSTG